MEAQIERRFPGSCFLPGSSGFGRRTDSSKLEVAAFELMANLLERADAKGIIVAVIPDNAAPAGAVEVECFVIGPEDLPSAPNLLRQALLAIAEQIGTPPPSSQFN